MKSVPQFSVIVPTHMRAKYLHRTLSSIKCQEFPGFCEIIVVSDVADPLTDSVCHGLLEESDTYIRRSGKPGPSESRNLALSLARGQYVLFLDDDDAWNPGCLNLLMHSTPFLQGRPAYFNAVVITEKRLPEDVIPIDQLVLDLKDQLTDEVFVKNQLHMSCVAFPRGLLKGLTFDPFMRAYEDWDFLLSVYKRMLPSHVPFWGAIIFEADDETSDRRGTSADATNFNAVLDYLYVYRRHPAPSDTLKQARSDLLKRVGMMVDPSLL